MAEKDTDLEVQESVTEDIASLSDVFNDEPETEVKGEEPEPVEAEAEVEETKAEEVETEPEPKAEPPSAEDQGRLAALLAERDKRQNAEKRIQELEAKLADTDPDYEPPEEAEDTHNPLLDKINMSRNIMLEVDPDFEKLEKVFMGLVVDNDGNIKDPSLLTQFQQSANPAKFAANRAKEHLRVQEVTDPTYQEKLEAQLREKILKELAEEGKKLKSTEVPDLTTASSAGSNSEKAVTQETLNDMFQDSPI